MNNPFLIQKQIQENVEDLQSYMKDLKNWEEDMKRRETEMKQDSNKATPPVRTKARKKETSEPVKKTEKEKPKRISSYDYSAWEKFDVEKECADVDNEVENLQKAIDEANYEKQLGNQLVKQEKWEEAIKKYTKAIQCYKHDAIYHANRGLCYLKLENFIAAEKDCTTAIKLDPTYVKAYQRRAAARTKLGQFKAAKEDLVKVLEYEPQNSASISELAKIETHLKKESKASSAQTSVKSCSSTTKLELKPDVKSQRKISNEKSIQSTNSTLPSKYKWKETNGSLVLPIKKAPHLRSKKPLKRIEVKDISELNKEEQSIKTECNTKLESSISLVTETRQIEGSKEDDVCSYKEPAVIDLPPIPKSSVHFHFSWKKLRHNSDLKFQYLKQIDGSALAKIFQDSLESNVLSELLSVLAKEFIDRNEVVYPYLVGLTKVRRFTALTMFLNKTEKEDIRKLIQYCIETGACSADEAQTLVQKYEIGSL